MVISIASQKGGTGKTSTSISLAAGLAHKGKRVLLVDIDSQANSSKVLLHHYPKIAKDQTIYATILERQPLVDATPQGRRDQDLPAVPRARGPAAAGLLQPDQLAGGAARRTPGAQPAGVHGAAAGGRLPSPGRRDPGTAAADRHPARRADRPDRGRRLAADQAQPRPC